MELKVNVRISNRHVHLTKETYDKLFDEELHIKTPLNQIGEFASDKTLTIRNEDKKFERVRVVGPLRNYNQIEVSKSDARILGVNPPVRDSGDLEGSLNILLETEKGSVETDGLIIAERHVHMTKEMAKQYGVVNREKVSIKIDGDKGAIMDAHIKITDNAYYEAHFDTDDANATLLKDNDEAILIINK